MAVTLRDVARQAHVSASTVSRALRDHPHVSRATRQAVVQAAEVLGYPMDNLRRPPDNSQTVLLLIHNADWQAKHDIRSIDVEGTIAFGAQSVLNGQSIISRIESARMERQEAEQYTSDPRIVGLIVASGVVEHDFVRELQASGLPFVIAGSHVRPLHANCVMADYLHGTEQAVHHLIVRGRQRVGLVNAPPSTTSSAEKGRGFRLALSLHERTPLPSRTVDCNDFTSESGYTQTCQLLAQAPDLDAVVYASDAIAIGGLRAIKESGRRVPEDVAITGFYDYEFSRFTDPPLTTVHVDLHAMGAIAARRLYMMLEGQDDQAWCVTVPTSLVVRAST